MKYAAMYKCPLCEGLIQCGEAVEIQSEQLNNALSKVIQNQAFIGNASLYQAPMYVYHHCPDGSGGMACFAGFKRTK